MEQYSVTGMSCAACQARIEKAVSGVPGVSSCAVSLLTNSMGVEGSATEEEIIRAVQAAGYDACRMEGAEPELEDTETPRLVRRLLLSLGFLLVLMYFSMGDMLFGWPWPSFIRHNHLNMGLVQLPLALIIMVINRQFFINGFKGLVHGAPNMDTLVALGSGASFLWSVIVMLNLGQGAAQAGGVDNMSPASMSFGDYYFESAAMILVLITVGKALEARSKGRTTSALKSLMRLAPKTALIQVDDQEKLVNIKDVKAGDVVLIKPGASVPVDGIVIEGSSAVNESALTGESIPVEKTVGDSVSAATINSQGFLKCRATKVGEDTTYAQIIRMVSDAAATKAPIAKLADKVSGVFVPVVMIIALVTFVVWLLLGQEISYALARAISVLVISCPCALGLATPVAIMVGNGRAASNGILFKTSEVLENTGRTNVVILDKTGTITKGEPAVVEVLGTDLNASWDEGDRKKLIANALALESRSEHPLAKAVVEYAKKQQTETIQGMEAIQGLGAIHDLGMVGGVTDFQVLPGHGLVGYLDEERLVGGNLRLIQEECPVPENVIRQCEEQSRMGRTPLFFARGGCFLGAMIVADVVKEDSEQAIRAMKDMGIRVVMLTGDAQGTAEAIGAQVGLNPEDIVAGVLPEGKQQVVEKFRKEGFRVAMVGDGINDAPALTAADVGMAIGNGTEVALDAAGVVLMKNSLLDVAAAIRLSRKTLKNIKENLFWAFVYNACGIPLAAGCLIHAFGWTLNPMFGAAAMSLSSFCVVTNALRLNLFNIYGDRENTKGNCTYSPSCGMDDRPGSENTQAQNEDIQENIQEKIQENIQDNIQENIQDNIQENIKEESAMTVTLKVEGMMCPHCEANVKKALEAIEGVETATPSHEKNIVEVQLSKEIGEETFKAVIEDKGYVFRGID